MRKFVCLFAAALSLAAQDRVDLGVVDRIKTEAFERSKVMDHLYQITEVRGPRLTGSPGFDEAAKWAAERLGEYGIQNVHLEHWGPFGKSWTVQQSSVELIEPRYVSLDAAPLAWSSSTNGPVSGDLILAPLRASYRDGPKKVRQEIDAWKAQWTGKLRGKIVLLNVAKIPRQQTNPQFRRYTDADLHDMSLAPTPAAKVTAKNLTDLTWPEDPDELGKLMASLPNALMEQIYDLYDSVASERGAFLEKEGVAGVILEDDRAHEGMVFAEAAGSFKSAEQAAPPTFVITAEQFDRIARAVDK